MKNRADIETRLLNELNHWFPRQCRNVYDDYYLWYAPTTAERDGGIMIAKDKPNGMELVAGERINKGATIEQNQNHFHGLLMSLPILERVTP